MTSTGKENQDDGEREGGGLIPAILAGAGLLVVAGLLIFGGNGGEEDQKGAGAGDKSHKDGAAAHESGKSGPKGGIGARPVDEAQTAKGTKPRLNPRLKRAIPMGSMAEQAPPGERPPPVFDDKDDEINYWQKELSNAEELLEIRKRAIKRMDKIRKQIESAARSPEDRERALDDFERRKGIVEKNLTKQQEQVEEIAGKLAALQG